MPWHRFFRPGDVLILALGMVAVGWSLPLLWRGGYAERALVRQDGQVFAEIELNRPRRLHVPGPLGDTVIAIEAGRARIEQDPGPRQYCVRQGWLSRAGEIAICAPNRVSLQIMGRTRVYDSLSY